MKYKTIWKGTLFTKTYVLNNAPKIRAERFKNKDLLDLADCTHIRELTLYSNKGDEPIDLSLLAHIQYLEILELERVSYYNLVALARLPNLRRLTIGNCKCFDFSDLNGLNQIKSLWLSDIKISSIPDDFGSSQMKSLEHLWLSSNRLKSFPNNLNLDSVTELSITSNDITDTGFLNHYRNLVEVDLHDNKIDKIGGLSENLSIEEFTLYNNPITDLSPLRSLAKLKYLEIPTELERQADLLKLPFYQEYENVARHPEEVDAFSIIENLEKEKFYSLKASQHLERAISRLIGSNNVNEDIIEMMLSHPNSQIYDYVVQRGIYEIYSDKVKSFRKMCLKDTSRLIPALTSAFRYYYENHDNWSIGHIEFSRNRLLEAHLKILAIAIEISGPQCSNLFKLYLEDYQKFSTYHQTAYKKVFDASKKTKNTDLVEYIIQAIPCEKLILGGDAAYIKKALNAVKSLGDFSHIKKLEAIWDDQTESRQDVIKTYTATLTTLEKRKTS